MLIDIDTAVVTHVAGMVGRLNSLKYPSTRVKLELVEDENTHLRSIELASRQNNHEPDTATRRFPFVIVYRGNSVSRVNSSSSSKAAIRDIVLREDTITGEVALADGKQISLEYVIYQYTTSFAELTELFEYWAVNIGEHHTAMDFRFSESQLNPVQFKGNIVFKEPESVRPSVSTIEDQGTVYIQKFPFTLDTIVLTNVRDSNELILQVQSTVYVLRPDEVFPV